MTERTNSDVHTKEKMSILVHNREECPYKCSSDPGKYNLQQKPTQKWMTRWIVLSLVYLMNTGTQNKIINIVSKVLQRLLIFLSSQDFESKR